VLHFSLFLLSSHPFHSFLSLRSSHWYEVPVFKDDPGDAISPANPNPDAITLLPFLRIFVSDKKADRKSSQRSVFHPFNPDNERRAFELLQNRCRTLLQAYPTTIKVITHILSHISPLSSLLSPLSSLISPLSSLISPLSSLDLPPPP
jgi:hypothetical protein